MSRGTRTPVTKRNIFFVGADVVIKYAVKVYRSCAKPLKMSLQQSRDQGLREPYQTESREPQPARTRTTSALQNDAATIG